MLVRGQLAPRVEPGAYRFSVAVHPPRTLPAALNGFGLWLGLMIGADHRELRLSDRPSAGAAGTRGAGGHASEPRDERQQRRAPERWPLGERRRSRLLSRRRRLAGASSLAAAGPDPTRGFARHLGPICSAAGSCAAPARDGSRCCSRPSSHASNVVYAAAAAPRANAVSIGRGATLALRCTMCHGARGAERGRSSPNLPGRRGPIYKQLLDFKTGARASAVMSPLVADLSDQDMRDLAAYYAYLPRLPS